MLDIRFAIGQSTLGAVLVAASGRVSARIFMGDDPQGLIHDLEKRFPKANLIGADRNFENLVAEVVGFDGSGRVSVLICRWICAARRSSKGCGGRYAKIPAGKQ
ncbi:hypothetical protein VXQ18_00610 [Brucella abortus]|nr:hypothetical protein [Brucella abortus]